MHQNGLVLDINFSPPNINFLTKILTKHAHLPTITKNKKPCYLFTMENREELNVINQDS